MKAEKTPIELNGTKYLLFDLNAFYEFDRVYGSLSKVFRAVSNDDSIIPYILHFGLLHEEDVPIEHLELLVDLSSRDTLRKQISQALKLASPDVDEHKNEAVPVNKDEAERPWEWDMLYYIGTVVLRMSESDFWSCTLRKLLSLIAAHRRYNRMDKEDEAQETASDEFIRNYM
ncbi:hypothetical protein PMSD_18360 [Paenibacillus macquariensis subsp. defensor]|nr:hypothetical protein PMSD_18360 [Paenibacillus macquariensis subsp. defensor]